MSNRSYTKRNRPVTACRECHRRKQRCDRLKPCNICLARNVPEKCLYGDDVLKLLNASKSKKPVAPPTPPSDHASTTDHEVESSPNNLEEQFGYSAFSDNAFLDLYKSINAIHVPTTSALGLSTVPLKPEMKEKYFNVIGRLPSRSICDYLIDTYFVEADWYFMSLDRYYFEKLYAAWKASDLPNETSILLEDYPRDLQHFPALLFQVLAVGLQFVPTDCKALRDLDTTDRAANDRQSQQWSDSGCEIMTILDRQTPSMAGVEHDIVRTTWLKNCSRGTESWHSIGGAISQAQTLELHQESNIVQMAENEVTCEQLWYDEYRRRVWSRVFSLDSHMAFVLGRPRHIHLDDCTVDSPTVCDIPEDLTNTRPKPPGTDEVPSSFASLMFFYKAGIKIHEIMSAKSKKLYQKDPSSVEKAHQDIETLLGELPPALQPLHPDTTWDLVKPHFPKVRQQIMSTASSILMKLHRPYVNTRQESRSAVIRAALGTLDAQERLFNAIGTSSNQYRLYGFSFYTIDASLLLSAMILSQCPQDLELINHANTSLQQGISRLGFLKTISRVAASGEQLLLKCYAEIQHRYPTFARSTVTSTAPPIFAEMSATFNQPEFLQHYNLLHPENLDLGALPDMLESRDYLMDEGINSTTALLQGFGESSEMPMSVF